MQKYTLVNFRTLIGGTHQYTNLEFCTVKEGEFERQHYLELFLQKSTKPIVFVIFQGVVKVTF